MDSNHQPAPSSTPELNRVFLVPQTSGLPSSSCLSRQVSCHLDDPSLSGQGGDRTHISQLVELRGSEPLTSCITVA